MALQKRFFDHYLKGADNGWEREPRVLLQIRHVDRFVPRTEAGWPIPHTRWTRFYLDAATMALTARGRSETATTAYEALGEGVTFTTAPLEQETEITGPAALKVFASSTTTD